MELTDEQIQSLRDLGQLGGRIATLRQSLERIVKELSGLQGKKTQIQSQLQKSKQDMQELWEEFR